MVSLTTRMLRLALIMVLCNLVDLSPIAHAQDPVPPEQDPAADERVRSREVKQANELVEQLRFDPEKPIDFEKLSLDELKAEIELRQRARRAALVLRVHATLFAYQAGLREQTLSTVLAAYTDLAQYDLENAATAADRVRALQTIVGASRRMEAEIRHKRDLGAIGGDVPSVMESTAHRLKWEQQLAKEILAMKQPASTK